MKSTDRRLEQLDPVRRLIFDRMKEVGINFADLSRALNRNQTYMHQFVRRGTPQRLEEDERLRIAAILNLPEEALRIPGATRSRSGPTSAKIGGPQMIRAYTDIGAAPIPGRGTSADDEIPVFTERDEFNPAKATEWIGRPPLLGRAGPIFACWISRDHGARLKAGDLAFIRVNQPPRVGEVVGQN